MSDVTISSPSAASRTDCRVDHVTGAHATEKSARTLAEVGVDRDDIDAGEQARDRCLAAGARPPNLTDHSTMGDRHHPP